MWAQGVLKLIQTSHVLDIAKTSSTPLFPTSSTTFLNKKLHTTSIRFKNFYDLLGLKQDATQDQIKAAYYEKAKDLHPDTGKSADPSAFHELSQAYEILGDIDTRTDYDRSLKLNQRGGPSYFTGGTNFNSAENYEWARRPMPKGRQASGANRQNMKQQTEPFNMSHIQYVYKTLNRQGEPAPPFRPFAEHEFSDSKFNRYEFGRHWDPERRSWVYTHRKPAERIKYDQYMKMKFKDLNYMIGISIFLIFSITVGPLIMPQRDSFSVPRRNKSDGYLMPEDVMQYKKPSE